MAPSSTRDPHALGVDPHTGGPAVVDEIVFVGPEGVVSLLGCCTLVVHTLPATVAIVSAMASAYEKAAASFKAIGHFCVIESESTLVPPGEVRGALAALMQRFDKRLAAAAIVYQAEGFKATAVRSIVTGLALASRITHPMQVFADIDAACSWTARLLEPLGGPSEAQFADAVRSLRGRSPAALSRASNSSPRSST